MRLFQIKSVEKSVRKSDNDKSQVVNRTIEPFFNSLFLHHHLQRNVPTAMQQHAPTNGSNRSDSSKATLPYELILTILELSASSYSTAHARNVCLVSRGVYNYCWPSLHRIIALRSAKQLKEFSEAIYDSHNKDSTSKERLSKKQNAIQKLYLNNNKDAAGIKELSTDERADMWMFAILLVARNLQLLHIEEFWSISFPWESFEDKPLLAYPLMLLTGIPSSLQDAFVDSSKSEWVQKLFQHRSLPSTDIFEEIFALRIDESNTQPGRSPRLLSQPREITLSALAMSTTHLNPSTQSYSPNGHAFRLLERLHLYFAKMDPLLVITIGNLPSLTHLRLTRPFSENLADGVYQLLGSVERGNSKMECIIIEAGIYMDEKTMTRLRELQNEPLGRDRLRFMDNAMFQHGPHKPLEVETIEGSADSSSSSSSSTQIINWVTNSEERGFAQFSERARGDDGIWSV